MIPGFFAFNTHQPRRAQLGKFFKTPKAVCGYTHVQRPSKFQKFETTLRFKSEKEIEEIVSAVKEMIVDQFGPKKAPKAKLPWSHDDESGDLVLKTTSKYKPKVYNAKGAQIDEDRVPAVYSGSTVRAGIKFDTYDNDGKYGVTARFQSLQVIKLVQAESGFDDASEEDEDAYTGDGVEGGAWKSEEDEDKPTKSKGSKKAKDEDDDEDDATAF